MQEYQVTVGGVRHDLERPLFVLATENPIEQEGTYPLPEAQLDRFMFNVVIDYPDADDERRILAETTTGAESAARPVATGAELEGARTLVRELPAASERGRLRAAPHPRHAPCRPDRARRRCATGCAGASGPRAGQKLRARRQGRAHSSTAGRVPDRRKT